MAEYYEPARVVADPLIGIGAVPGRFGWRGGSSWCGRPRRPGRPRRRPARWRVRGFDGQRASSVDDADVDTLLGNDQRAAAGDASLHTQRLGRRIDAGAAAP